jgi:flagellar basal-body rod protein FlgF
MRSAEKRLEVIASNLANVDSNGFKRSSASSREFARVLNGRIERELSTTLQYSFAQGALRQTSETYDFALSGDGFFAVEGSQGELLTRDGRFFVDDEGVLQTFEGLPVVWDGARGTIDPAGQAITVDAEGVVRQAANQVGKLRVVDFDDKSSLTVDSRGFFVAPSSALEKAPEAQVRQGYLEQSNVSAVDEMVAMIAVQRQFESGARVMSAIDQTYRRLTNPR